jgi:hypothetical protein
VKSRPGTRLFVAGFSLLAVLLAASILFGASGLLLLGLVPMLVAAGAMGLVGRGLASRGRRAAGQTCGECPRKIVFEHEAELCDRCGVFVHADCSAAHAHRAHAVEGGSPFR